MNREEFDIWQKGIYETINEASIIGLSQLKGDVGTHNNRTPEQIKANNEKKASLRAKAVEKMKSAASKAGEAIKNGAKAVAQKTGKVIDKAKDFVTGKGDDRPTGLSSLDRKPDSNSNSAHKPASSKDTPVGLAGLNKGKTSSTASKFAKGVQNAKANPAPQPKASAKGGDDDNKTASKTQAKASKKPNAPQLKTDDSKTVTDTVLKHHTDDEGGKKKSLGQKLKDTAKKAIKGANDLKWKAHDAKEFVKDTWNSRDAANKRKRGIKDEPKTEKAKENLNKKNNNPQQSTNSKTTASNSNGGSSNGGSTVHVHVHNHNDEHAQKNAQSKAQAEKDREDFFKKVNNKSKAKAEETKAEAGEETKTETATEEPKAEETKANKTEEKKAKEPKVAKAIKKTVAKKLKKGAEEKKNAKENKAKGDEPTGKSDDKPATKPVEQGETKPQNAENSEKKPAKKPSVIKDIPKNQQSGGKDLSQEPATKKLAPGEAKGSHGLQHKKTKGAEASMYDDEKGNPVPATPAEQKAKDGDVGKHTAKKAILVKKNKTENKPEEKTENKAAEEKKNESKAEEKKDSTPKVEPKKEKPAEEKKEDSKPKEKKEEPTEEKKAEPKKEEAKTEPKKTEKKAEVNDKGQKLLKYNSLPGQREKDKENASKVGNTKGGKEISGKDEIEKHNNEVRYGEHHDKTSKMNKVKKRHNEHDGDSEKIEAHKALTKKMAEIAKTHSKEDADKARAKVKEVYKSKLSDREKKRGDKEGNSKKAGLAKLAMKEKKKEKPAEKKDNKPKKISLANLGKKKD